MMDENFVHICSKFLMFTIKHNFQSNQKIDLLLQIYIKLQGLYAKSILLDKVHSFDFHHKTHICLLYLIFVHMCFAKRKFRINNNLKMYHLNQCRNSDQLCNIHFCILGIISFAIQHTTHQLLILCMLFCLRINGSCFSILNKCQNFNNIYSAQYRYLYLNKNLDRLKIFHIHTKHTHQEHYTPCKTVLSHFCSTLCKSEDCFDQELCYLNIKSNFHFVHIQCKTYHNF